MPVQAAAQEPSPALYVPKSEHRTYDETFTVADSFAKLYHSIVLRMVPSDLVIVVASDIPTMLLNKIFAMCSYWFSH